MTVKNGFLFFSSSDLIPLGGLNPATHKGLPYENGNPQGAALRPRRHIAMSVGQGFIPCRIGGTATRKGLPYECSGNPQGVALPLRMRTAISVGQGFIPCRIG